MKKSISIFLAVFLTAILLTGCLSSGGNTVRIECVTGVDMTESEFGSAKQWRMEFDETTGVLTAEADGVLVEHAFNRNGDLLSVHRYYPNGELWNSHVYTYDDAGKLIKTESYYDNSPAEPSAGKTEYIYDESGTLEKTVSYRDDWLASETFYRKDGSIAQRINHIYGYEEDFRHIYDYAEDGRVLTRRDVRDGKDTGGEDYVCDDNGVLLQKIAYINEETRMENICTMHYDSKGNRVEYSIVDYQGDSQWYRYTYDEDGNMLTRQYSEDPEGFGYAWTYDEEGRVISQSVGGWPAVHWTYDANGRIATYTSGDSVTTYTYTYKTFRLPEALAAAVAEAVDRLVCGFVQTPVDYEWDP